MCTCVDSTGHHCAALPGCAAWNAGLQEAAASSHRWLWAVSLLCGWARVGLLMGSRRVGPRAEQPSTAASCVQVLHETQTSMTGVPQCLAATAQLAIRVLCDTGAPVDTRPAIISIW